MQVIYPWPRFWVPRDGVIDLSDAGFLRDPTDWLAQPPSPVPLAALQHWRSLALLGEPGIGKSTTLKEEADRVASLPAEADLVSIYVDLRAFSSEESTAGYSKARSSLPGRMAVRICLSISTALMKRSCASTRSLICSPRSCRAFRRTGCQSVLLAAPRYGQPIRSRSP
jgi:hypothetical protein